MSSLTVSRLIAWRLLADCSAWWETKIPACIRSLDEAWRVSAPFLHTCQALSRTLAAASEVAAA